MSNNIIDKMNDVILLNHTNILVWFQLQSSTVFDILLRNCHELHQNKPISYRTKQLPPNDTSVFF